MGKVKQNEIKRNEKKAAPRSTAMTRAGEQDFSARNAAIQQAAQRGYAAMEKRADEADTQLDGMAIIDDKEALCGVPFLILDVTIRPGKHGTDFCSFVGMLESGELFVVNDGGLGIMSALEGVDVTPDKPLKVPGGLRVSKYTNEHGDCATFYLSANKPQSKLLGLQRGVNGASSGAGRRGGVRSDVRGDV